MPFSESGSRVAVTSRGVELDHSQDGSMATHPGVYCLRSSETDWDEDTLWRTYSTLTDVEAVFRALKSDLPQGALSDRRPADHVGHGQNVLPDRGCKAQQAHDLGHAGPGEAFSTGELGLVGGVPGLDQCLPLDGLAAEFDDSGCRGNLGGSWLSPTLRYGAHDPVSGHAGRQGADVAVLKAPLGARPISTVCSR